ncbi:hypothetical protein [Chitinophaga sp. HK235]|uniref:hypothetical protein n=1 Tax=Chitinophaga sp. HK235 TaxID=2952571 RepID=UPI001BA54ECD|nr:hypothetical protein [Chitinophaga sp. HK235]
MYYVKKYSNCWAIHNDDTGASRPLTENEKNRILEEHPSLNEGDVRAVYADIINNINEKP